MEIKARKVTGSKAAAVSPEETNQKTTEEEMVEAFATKSAQTGKKEGGKGQDKAPFMVATNTAGSKLIQITFPVKTTSHYLIWGSELKLRSAFHQQISFFFF